MFIDIDPRSLRNVDANKRWVFTPSREGSSGHVAQPTGIQGAVGQFALSRFAGQHDREFHKHPMPAPMIVAQKVGMNGADRQITPQRLAFATDQPDGCEGR